MTKDPKKQKRILELIEKIWKKNPSLRFMQLLLNCFDEDAYYVGDALTIKRLEAVYKEYL